MNSSQRRRSSVSPQKKPPVPKRLKSLRGSTLQLLRSANEQQHEQDTWSIFDKLGAGFIIRGSNVRSRVFSTAQFNLEDTTRAMMNALSQVFEDVEKVKADPELAKKLHPNQLVALFRQSF